MTVPIRIILILIVVSFWVCPAFLTKAEEPRSVSGSDVSEKAPDEPAPEGTGDTQYSLPEVTVSDEKESEGETQGYIAEDANTATKTERPHTPYAVFRRSNRPSASE